jgi:osmotically-inducible protein OsmY
VAFTALLAGPVAGCAEYSAYRECGAHGCADDAKITAEVRALLSQHPALGPPNQVYVQTMNQVVYLSGQVATDLQRETAESIATAAAGGHRIVDIIALEYSGR